MTERLVLCQKRKVQAPGLDTPPYPGALGQRIFDAVSKEAWQQWIAHQTILINEYRLNMLEPEARAFLNKEMESFLFGEGSQKPAAFTPVSD